MDSTFVGESGLKVSCIGLIISKWYEEEEECFRMLDSYYEVGR